MVEVDGVAGVVEATVDVEAAGVIEALGVAETAEAAAAAGMFAASGSAVAIKAGAVASGIRMEHASHAAN
ncbi:unnamed protein product [Phytophthora fragariaefolia]|uniref:Unnamed protein product n=1 Tax=Phytophthora fragariaefolia TaxID=1490495 RepID=A0A9W7CRT2_9STRA|nr:unnamed protein product [Phytophthora fragariaefolia]